MASLTNLLPDLTSISLALLGIKRFQRQTSNNYLLFCSCRKIVVVAFTLAQRRVTYGFVVGTYA